MKRALSTTIRMISLLCIVACTMLPAWGAEPTDPPYVGVWIGADAALSDDGVQKAIDEIARRNAAPQHVVVLVHGLATTREESAAQYTRVARDITTEFQKRGQSLVVVGLQWDSTVPKAWIGDVVVSVLGFGPKDNPYMKKVALARQIGSMGARQLLLRIQERFPESSLSLMAHSLGSELVHHAVQPEFKDKGARAVVASFRPETNLKLLLLVLCGADMDYDVAWRNHGQFGRGGAIDLVWLTVATISSVRSTDLALDARSVVRGTQALGNRFPRMTEQQINALCKSCGLVLDSQDIPAKHAFLSYYAPARLSRLADAAAGLRDHRPHTLLKRLDAIIAAPAEVAKLTPFLDDLETSVQFYTLWRLECVMCGGPRHLADGTITSLSGVIAEHPQWLDRESAKSPCEVIRRRLWPTPRLIQYVLDRLPGARCPTTTSGFDGP